MIHRICKLLGFKIDSYQTADKLIMFDQGNTVPTDGTAGYGVGAIFQHRDGGAGTSNYQNEGTETSSAFAAVAGLTAAQEAAFGKKYVQTEVSDISGANAGYAVSPMAGTISKVYTVIDTAITVGDATLTVSVDGGTDVTQAVVIATSGSAAGTTDSCTPADNNTVAVGSNIKIVSDGGSTDSSKAVVVFEITPA